MTDLAGWFAAQLDADEQTARAAIAGPWAVADNGEVYAPSFDREYRTGLNYPSRPATVRVEHLYVTCDGEGLSPSVEPADAEHIARHDPAFVLADITAKRRILALHQPIDWEDSAGPRQTCRLCGDTVTVDWPCETVRLLVAPNASRPGYDPSWAPEQPAHNTAGDTT